jgi:hypothetical protein
MDTRLVPSTRALLSLKLGAMVSFDNTDVLPVWLQGCLTTLGFYTNAGRWVVPPSGFPPRATALRALAHLIFVVSMFDIRLANDWLIGQERIFRSVEDKLGKDERQTLDRGLRACGVFASVVKDFENVDTQGDPDVPYKVKIDAERRELELFLQ